MLHPPRSPPHWGGVAEAVLRLLCAGEWDLVCIKPRGHCMKVLRELAAALPKAKHLFLYRDGLKTVESMATAFSSEPVEVLRELITRVPVSRCLFPSFLPSLIATTVISHDSSLDWCRDEAFFCALSSAERQCLFWASVCREYESVRAEGVVGVRGLRYEEVVADPAAAAKAMMSFAGTAPTEEALRGAAEAARQHSHLGAANLFSPQRLKGFPRVRLAVGRGTPSYDLCRRMGVPPPGEETRLGDTLEVPGRE
mmetsp:Transcript_17871/g.60754  ORF Transcript_17871/g.60754 Transcript_17871/m.60754 type:complete len:254 (-) Transcript_17871:31-792(-)